MNNRGISRVALSFVIVGLFALGLFSFAAYKANNPGVEVAGNTNSTSTATEENNNLPIKGIVSKPVDEDGDEADEDDKQPTIPTTSPQTTTPPPVDTTKKTAKYRDGSYTAVGSYNSPGGMDEIGISLTLKDNIVTSVSATPMAHDGTSDRYQQKFISGFQPLVVGKNIDTLQLGKVSGSSLTGIGFNDAISKIKVEAKA